jgi:hypothetical protein
MYVFLWNQKYLDAQKVWFDFIMYGLLKFIYVQIPILIKNCPCYICTK